MMRPQIVLDTNVLFAGLYSRTGASFVLLDQLYQHRVDIHLSVPLVLEYEDVLKRDASRLGLTDADVDAAINALCSIGKHHDIHYLWRPFLTDPKDDLVLELAVASRCPIITHNLRDFAGTKIFGIQVLTPVQFLRKIGVPL